MSLIGNAIYIQPVKEVITTSDPNTSQLQLLRKSKGAWGKTSAQEENLTHQREQLEEEDTKLNKSAKKHL